MGQVTDASTDSANLSALSSSRARFVPFLGGALAAALPRWHFALLEMLWRAPCFKSVLPLRR